MKRKVTNPSLLPKYTVKLQKKKHQEALGGTQKIGSIKIKNLLNLQLSHDICLNQGHLCSPQD